MKKRIAGIVLAGCLFWEMGAANAQLLQRSVRKGSPPLPAFQNWGKTPDKDILFPLHYHTRIKPESILIGRDHPNGTRFLAMFPHDGVPLPLKFSKDFHGFDNYGDLKPGYTVEITEYRFAHDSGEPELIILVGNGRTDLTVNILRYHAPATAKDAARVSNWMLEGSLHGQSKAILEEGRILFPLGVYQDVIMEHPYHNGKFH